MNVDQSRKSLMLDKREYSQISKLASTAKVPRPVVIKAMLACLDERALMSTLQRIRAEEKANAAEERKKRAALAALASEMDMEQIEQLLSKMKS